jgi:hypothetical protein
MIMQAMFGFRNRNDFGSRKLQLLVYGSMQSASGIRRGAADSHPSVVLIAASLEVLDRSRQQVVGGSHEFGSHM